MPKPPLSMTPTGWFQVAWSAEVPVGHVHRASALGEELVIWRSRAGRVIVMDAYCKHLGAHLGHGGTVVDETIQCPFHGWKWNSEGRNTEIPYADHANRGRKITTYPVTERNESIYIWFDLQRRDPYFEVPDVFSSWDDGTTASDYHSCYPGNRLFEERLSLHPQYVLENGVDFAHFTFVHKVPIIPVFTRQEFDEPTSYVDFTITFDGQPASIDDVHSGVEAINGGLGVSVTRSHGMVDNRTATCVTPVDDETSDVRFSVWIRRRPDLDEEASAGRAAAHARGVIEQFEADLGIWKYQKYSDPAALAPGEYEGFSALRAWATQFYPDPV